MIGALGAVPIGCDGDPVHRIDARLERRQRQRHVRGIGGVHRRLRLRHRRPILAGDMDRAELRLQPLGKPNRDLRRGRGQPSRRAGSMTLGWAWAKALPVAIIREAASTSGRK